ncbi:hypothetical protein PUN28_012903 [Cardiocondyla obscurior]|uniref:Uncharacterized protein n=1 Tax=Cardiocondyla obscurior TaxID=286306 RepID=A0AAW2F5Y4_9HYME
MLICRMFLQRAHDPVKKGQISTLVRADVDAQHHRAFQMDQYKDARTSILLVACGSLQMIPASLLSMFTPENRMRIKV